MLFRPMTKHCMHFQDCAFVRAPGSLLYNCSFCQVTLLLTVICKGDVQDASSYNSICGSTAEEAALVVRFSRIVLYGTKVKTAPAICVKPAIMLADAHDLRTNLTLLRALQVVYQVGSSAGVRTKTHRSAIKGCVDDLLSSVRAVVRQ